MTPYTPCCTQEYTSQQTHQWALLLLQPMPQYWRCSCQHVGRSTQAGAWCCCWYRHDGGCCLVLQQLHHGVVRGVLQVRCQVLWCSERCALLVCWMCGPARANQQKQFFCVVQPPKMQYVGYNSKNDSSAGRDAACMGAAAAFCDVLKSVKSCRAESCM